MLTKEIKNAQRFVRTDAYQMSVGEIVSMYEGQEIIIDPEFQRLFRWDISQKSRLIESLLLGIPLPSIFVFEKEDGIWELIDGLQRISTILEFMGKLRGSDGGIDPPSILEATKYLPSLHNAVWEKSDLLADVPINAQKEFDKSHQLSIRRARIGVEILKRTSDEQTKFDLFQRLNAGGTLANAQELRNCIMLMVNSNYYRAVKVEAERREFQKVLSLNEDQISRQRHLELAVRFLVHTYEPYNGITNIEEYIEEYIDNGIVNLAKGGTGAKAADTIRRTFHLLYETAGKDALRRFMKGNHSGKVGLVGLEGIAVGVAKNLDAIYALEKPKSFVKKKIQDFWSQPETEGLTVAGLRGTTRIQRTVPFGEEWFRPNE